MTKTAVRRRLETLAEEDYRQFAAKLLPDVDGILGVRLPALRQIAREIARSQGEAYFARARHDSFEEIMLHGMVIGCLNTPLAARLAHIGAFVPLIDNWSVCDSFCAGLKCTRENPALMWDFLQPYFVSEQPFAVRFAVVMVIFYYTDTAHLPAVFRHFDHIRHENYYVKMAVAWAVSMCYAKCPAETSGYLKNNRLDDFTHNKALQKICESRQIRAEEKTPIRRLKRPIKRGNNPQ